MKRKDDIFSIIIIFIIFTFGFLIYKNHKQKSKYENQKIGVSIEEFKSDWGKPNKEFIYKDDDNNIFLVYDCNNFLGDKYIFKFDKTTNALIFKYYDD